MRLVLGVLFAVSVAAMSCNPTFHIESTELILATTTSTRDSGLLDVLLPVFERETGYLVKPIAVGSGQAIAMGERGEADVLLVHSPDSEQEFMANGHGSDRRVVMYNDFVLLGPRSDPAEVRESASVTEAFIEIARSEALFISRGDNSGTHAQEQSIWKAVGIDPTESRWHQESGQGMGATLNIANEKDGYTLADRGTFLARKASLRLEIVVEGDESLLNTYHVIVVNSANHPGVNFDAAKVFSEFLTSPDAQELIRTFGVEKYGEALFFSMAGDSD